MPADYINKLARMFQDIKVSEDLNQEFKKHYRSKGDIAGTEGVYSAWSSCVAHLKLIDTFVLLSCVSFLL